MLKEISNLGRALSRAEQKNVFGGIMSESGPGDGTCAAFSPCTLPGDHDDTCGGGDLLLYVTKAEAQAHVANGGYWCCESCSSASWYPY